MTLAIETRYAKLASSCCSLSCGSTLTHVQAAPGQLCVDLGSGRGTDVLRMAEAVGPSGQAFGVDITDSMLDAARAKAEKLGLANATFVRAELEALPLPSASADWVTSNCVLNHALDKAAVWREIARVLKPGGRFVVSDIYAVEPVPEEYRDDPEAIAECWAGAIQRPEYLAAIAAAGFERVEVLEESEPYDKGHARVASFTLAGVKPGKP